MKKILSAILLLLCACVTRAGTHDFSYLYIQGDKQTPFYVKLEDAMQPRFGKNYCIIPKLAPGPVHIEILFQQNAFPAQEFTVLIPYGGSRGFLLVKSDAGFSLYDLQQGFYLPAGNKAEDDRLPAANNRTVPVAQAIEPSAVAASEVHEPEKQLEQAVKKTRSVAKKTVRTKPAQVEQKQEAADGKPVFIRDMELTKGEPKNTTGDSNVLATGNATLSAVIPNTDCPTPISSGDFGKIFTAMSGFATDEEKLEYLGGQMNLCYETWQARTLAGKLSGDVARYTLLKKIYPRITDQAAFPLLDDLLTTDTWKEAFNHLVHP